MPPESEAETPRSAAERRRAVMELNWTRRVRSGEKSPSASRRRPQNRRLIGFAEVANEDWFGLGMVREVWGERERDSEDCIFV